jgi:phosphoglycolate phosphatase-like HAD superfamily hydrolase
MREYTVIFDFDGTLANTVSLMIDLYNNVGPEYGALPITEDEFDELRILGYKKAMKAKNIKLRVLPKIAMTVSKEMKLHMDDVKPYDGIVDMLKQLKVQGINLGILTSNNAGLVHDFLEVNDFPEFDFVVSEKTFFGKEKALKRIMKRHNIPKEQIIYVGDEPRDVVSSIKAGVRVFAVTWGLGGVEGLKKTPPDRLVSTPSELYDCVIEAIQ